MALIIELDPEAASVVALALVHKGRNVGVVEEALVIHRWLTNEIFQENFVAGRYVRNKVLSQLSAGVA